MKKATATSQGSKRLLDADGTDEEDGVSMRLASLF
jgi:hypothetical protein